MGKLLIIFLFKIVPTSCILPSYFSGNFFIIFFAVRIFFEIGNKNLLARPNTVLFSYIIKGKLNIIEAKEMGKDT